MNYSNEELTDMYLCFGLSERINYIALGLYLDLFPDRYIPDVGIFEVIDRYLRENGRLPNVTKKNKLERRLAFCHWFSNRSNQHNGNFTQKILFTDEKEFKGNGIHHNYTLNVWAGIIGDLLIGPIFLPSRLSGSHYFDFLKNNLPFILNDIPPEHRSIMWFMHDGAPPHSINSVRNLLNQSSYFPNRWIGRGGPVHWPSDSSSLNPMDFYVWKNISDAIDLSQECKDINEFKQQIIDAFQTFRNDRKHFSQINTHMFLRIKACIDTNGGPFESKINNIFRVIKRM